jgi:monoamine oxidase
MSESGRREFIKRSVMAGIGAAVTGVTQAGSSSPDAAATRRRVIVAGAGISGLCCAYELMKKGHEVIVLEANGRYGGHVLTERDDLADGLYPDFGADHVTIPGYERLVAYLKELDLTLIPYPHAEGSEAARDAHRLKIIDGVIYSEEMLADRALLAKLGFNPRETHFLSSHPWCELPALYVKPYLAKFSNELQPFGVGYDRLDDISMAEFYRREGASAAAIRFADAGPESALYSLWRFAVMEQRGIPLSEGDTYRIRGGNQELPTAFARRLGDRVKLNHPILSIKQSDTGISVVYRAFGYPDEQELTADVLVNCIPLSVFRNIAVTPPLSSEKQYVVDNLGFTSHPFYVFEASSPFWLDDGLKSINMEFEHPGISSIWQEATDVETSRVILKAYAPGGMSAQQGLAAFRQVYPGKRDTIVRALTVDWTRDKFSPSCEMLPFPVGQTHRFWPQLLQPEGRIYFVGTYADPLSRGMESCIRAAQRVAHEIDRL